MPPAGLDQSAVLAALSKRGGVQGGGVPLLQQRSAPGGATPVGGPNVPLPGPAGVSRPPSQLPATRPPKTGAAAAQAAQGPQFDEETRTLGKALVKKLLDVM